MNFTTKFLEKFVSLGDGACMVFRDEKVSRKQLCAKIDKLSGSLVDLGAKRIATLCFNSDTFVALVLAAVRVGVELLPLNPSFKDYEIKKYAKDADLIISDIPMEHAVQLQELLSDKIHLMDADTGGVVFYSSGTTGPPKPFFYSQQLLLKQIEQLQAIEKCSQLFSPGPEDVCYGVLPYFHAGGLITVLSALWSGATVVVNERFDPESFMKTIEAKKVTILFIVPPIMKFLAKCSIHANVDTLKAIYVGAAATPRHHFESVRAKFPLTHLIQLYGITELGVLLASTQRGICDGRHVGKPFPEVEIAIKQNRIFIKSSSTNGKFKDSGDLGFFDESANLHINGRSKEMIKVRGWQVNPSEIEEVVSLVEGVDDCAVFEREGLLIGLIVGNADENTVLTAVKTNLASYKQLNEVRTVESLPRNASGKLMRHLLQ